MEDVIWSMRLLWRTVRVVRFNLAKAGIEDGSRREFGSRSMIRMPANRRAYKDHDGSRRRICWMSRSRFRRLFSMLPSGIFKFSEHGLHDRRSGGSLLSPLVDRPARTKLSLRQVNDANGRPARRERTDSSPAHNSTSSGWAAIARTSIGFSVTAFLRFCSRSSQNKVDNILPERQVHRRTIFPYVPGHVNIGTRGSENNLLVGIRRDGDGATRFPFT